MFGRLRGFPFPIANTPDGLMALVPSDMLHEDQRYAGVGINHNPEAYRLHAGTHPSAGAIVGTARAEESSPRPVKDRLEAKLKSLEEHRADIQSQIDKTNEALKLVNEQPGLVTLLEALRA